MENLGLNIKLTSESVREAHALVVASATEGPNADALLIDLLLERIGGAQDGAEVIRYLANVLLSAVTIASSLAQVYAEALDLDLSGILQTVALANENRLAPPDGSQ